MTDAKATIATTATTDQPLIVRQLLGVLRADADRWAELASLDPTLLRRVPAPGEWSALECLGHAVDTESPVFTARTLAFLAGEPTLRSYDPDAERTPIDETTDPADLLARHAAMRAESIEVVSRVTEADLDRTAHHTELGLVSLRDMLNEFAGHELMHIVQAERAILQAFIPASGPWRGYFADHDVDRLGSHA